MAAAMPAIGAVLPQVTVVLRRSTGWTPGPTGKQVPVYAAAVSGPGSDQPISQAALAKIDGLNQQGRYRSVYLYGAWFGVVRPGQTGGDMLQLPDGSWWLVEREMERYPDWTRVLACLQTSGPPP
jgi:hypothetical protein